MFKMELLKGFVAVATHSSFSKAAREADISPMAVSKQVAALEQQLKEPLFERSTRKVRLTELGLLFLPRAQKIINQQLDLSEWIDSRQQSPTGTLRVLAQESEILGMSVTPWVSQFCKKYPNIELEIDVSERLVEIDKEPFDIYWGMSEYLGRFSPGLKRRSIFKGSYGIYASPDYLNKYGTPKTISDLDQHRLISYLHNQPNNMLVVDIPDYVGQGLPFIEMNAPIKTVQGILELAEQGLGIINCVSVIPTYRESIKAGRIVPILQEFWLKDLESFIYFHQSKIDQPKVRAFIDFFLEKKDTWFE